VKLPLGMPTALARLSFPRGVARLIAELREQTRRRAQDITPSHEMRLFAGCLRGNVL
jgi:hypothetical protein